MAMVTMGLLCHEGLHPTPNNDPLRLSSMNEARFHLKSRRPSPSLSQLPFQSPTFEHSHMVPVSSMDQSCLELDQWIWYQHLRLYRRLSCTAPASFS